MRRNPLNPLWILCFLGLCWDASAAVAGQPPEAPDEPQRGRVYFVRQTVGDDANDGLTPATAWSSLGRLATLEAGDTGYVGPGLYREQVRIYRSGTAESPIRLIADPSGRHTGDPAGVVMVSGADPVDEGLFEAHGNGVYRAEIPGQAVLGIVEMDGPQHRYWRIKDVEEFRREGFDPVELVAKRPSSFFFDSGSRMLYLHTSDGRSPLEHEIELITRGGGFVVRNAHFVTVVGFTLRHVGDAAINFFTGSSHCVAIRNTAYGSRQGVRVNNATDVLVVGNTLFRNENSGAYFLRRSTNGRAVGNITFENAKGLRWGSGSADGLASGNVAFDNLEIGISVEDVTGMLVGGNRLINNREAQLLAFKSRYQSEGNCFERGSEKQLTASFLIAGRYASLAEYQQASHQDRGSREGDCGPPPQKIDVHELHAASSSYAERARQALSGQSGAGEETRGDPSGRLRR